VPKEVCGFHLDHILAYETRKLVRIEDRNLGILYYSLVLLVGFWVIGFQILYGNEHFQLFDVKGTARMTIQQPTEGCNPNNNDCKDAYKPMSDLPYCVEYTGDKSKIPENMKQQKCKFADQHEMAPEGMLDDRIFMPTRIDTHLEKQGCSPGPENGHSCDKAYEVEVMKENIYVADVEDYTIMFVHSYYRGDIMGNSLFHQGYYEQCTDRKTGKVITTKPCAGKLSRIPIACLTGDCAYEFPAANGAPPSASSMLPLLRGQKKDLEKAYEKRKRNETSVSVIEKQRAQAQVSLQKATTQNEDGDRKKEEDTSKDDDEPFAIGSGDIFTLRKLLELAGLDLDLKTNYGGEPYREAGTALEVQVEYNNLHPWKSTFGHLDVGYTYRVIERSMEEIKTEKFAPKQPDDFPVHRMIENRHGIMLIVTVSGTFGYFNVVYLLVMLTTSLALLAGATKIVDLLALYCLKRREEYRRFKYKIAA